jgi:glutamate synthase (ferredoxin)
MHICLCRSWLEHAPVHSNGITFDDYLMSDPVLQAAINDHNSFSGKYHISNTDRAAFSRISGHIAKKYGDHGFKGQLTFTLTGGAGQSFAAFLSHNMHVLLHGYANDYVGKGMAGGKIVIRPPQTDLDTSSTSHSVAGNTLLYGATAGKVYLRGKVGERFAVRNSGAVAVVEGVGDHGCEYMTAGNVLILGDIGRNFGAGMTGGLAFILNPDNNQVNIDKYINTETVSLVLLLPQHNNAIKYIRNLLTEHIEETDSNNARRVLEQQLQSGSMKAYIVVPNSEKNNPLLSLDNLVGR